MTKQFVFELVCAICAIVAVVLGLVDLASGSDYTVSRSVRIESERSIAWLILEMGMGVMNEHNAGLSGERIGGFGEETQFRSTILSVDGVQKSGIKGMAQAGWRLVGFILWDAAGIIDRTTICTIRGHAVRISDRIENGRVLIEVVVGPPLGDPHVRQARLTLEAKEHDSTAEQSENLRLRSSPDRTMVFLSCSADLDLPGDGCRLVRRLARRIADREAGPELSGRVNGLADAGRRAVLAGRGEIDAVVAEFIRRVCDR